MRFFLAIRCFFRILFGQQLPNDSALMPLLPAAKTLQAPALPPPQPVTAGPTPGEIEKIREAASQEGQKQGLLRGREQGAVELLMLLQRDGRLVDFLREPVDQFTDAQIGAAVRTVHAGCQKVISEVVVCEQIRSEADGANISVEGEAVKRGLVKLVGQIGGHAPYRGVLRHPGWQAKAVHLPTTTFDASADRVVAPAEVELS